MSAAAIRKCADRGNVEGAAAGRGSWRRQASRAFSWPADGNGTALRTSLFVSTIEMPADRNTLRRASLRSVATMLENEATLAAAKPFARASAIMPAPAKPTRRLDGTEVIATALTADRNEKRGRRAALSDRDRGLSDRYGEREDGARFLAEIAAAATIIECAVSTLDATCGRRGRGQRGETQNWEPESSLSHAFSSREPFRRHSITR